MICICRYGAVYNEQLCCKLTCLTHAYQGFPSIVNFNSLPACGEFRHLLITLANSLDQDQARQNVRPDLDPNCLTL